jgi:hypothetical protein
VSALHISSNIDQDQGVEVVTVSLRATAGAATAAEIEPAGLLRKLHPRVMKMAVGQWG